MPGLLRNWAERRCAARPRALKAGVASAALLVFSGHAWGADAVAPLVRPSLDPEAPTSPATPVRDFNTYMPTAKATRIETAEAPVIDGDISDPVWAKAEAVSEFYQIEPNTGQPGSERTELRFLYDADNLYIAVHAYDREPDQIRFTTKNRDGSFVADDGVRIYLDPLNTRRNAYHFIVNPLGARIDELIQNNTDFVRPWNTIWAARSRIVEDGWTVEIAIPFRDLSFDPTKPDWVIDFSRDIRRRNESDRWSSISAAQRPADISRAGTLTGITDINQGLGLDIQLYGSARYRFDWQQPQRETKSARLSGNAFYRITPQLTGTLTVNPDFSDSPLDLLQVNTTRFNLFQPETRNFFLQDTATFEFGGRGFTIGGRGSDYPYPPENASPFFSRNIGLANGLPVSLIGGTKLSGEYAGLGIGALSVVTNGTGDTKRSQVLSVARVTKTIGESKAGILITNGDPTGRSKNTLAGADFQFRDSNWTPGKILQSDFYYQRSFSDTKGEDDSFGVAVNYPNEPIGVDVRFKQVGRNFFPALGFVNRTSIRQFDGVALYRRRDLGWRWLDVGTSWYFVTSLNNHLESRENSIWSGIALRSGDEFYVKAFDDYEDVPATFKVAGKVPVPAGRYHWTNGSVSFQTAVVRPYSASLEVLCCSFYNGSYLRADFKTDFRANATFQLTPHYTFTHIDLPGGLLNIHAITTDFIISFTPDMQLVNQVQFDNVSERFALSMRYRWEYEPGQEIFVSVGQSALIPGEEFTPRSTQVVIRLGHTFRY
jgi:hypothetical protein